MGILDSIKKQEKKDLQNFQGKIQFVPSSGRFRCKTCNEIHQMSRNVIEQVCCNILYKKGKQL